MLTTARPTSDPIAQAVAWISTRGVEVVHWTTDHHDLDHVAPDHPVLYLLDPTAVAPWSWDALEDWVRLPADSSELYDRAERLLVRAAELGSSRTFVDDDDVLRAGTRIVPLSPMEAELVRTLLDRAGTLVPRTELEEQLWPAGSPSDPRALDNRLKRLRKRLDDLPLRIHTVRGRGFLLERTAHPDATGLTA